MGGLSKIIDLHSHPIPISHDGLKAVPGRSRLCSFRNQVLPTGDSSCVYDGWPFAAVS
jgi:hypothetical protein